MNVSSHKPKDLDAGIAPAWKATLLTTILAAVSVTLIFYQTAWSMVTIWLRSETYSYGFLIFPVALWMIWDKHEHLLKTRPSPNYRVLVLAFPIGFVWLLAHQVNVLVIQQYAFISLLIVSVWAQLGNKAAWVIAFPLGFLFLAVPVGDSLLPHLMDFTSDFTVALLRASNIPVFQEGTFFTLPTGSWSVVEACAGLRFLHAAIALAVIYSFFTYQRWHKRVIFIALAVIGSILSNGLRAYIIVLIGHFSQMKYGQGLDHYVIGWILFGLMFFAMFAIGAKWREPHPTGYKDTHIFPTETEQRSRYPTLFLTLAMAALWPVWNSQQQSGGNSSNISIPLPTVAGGWQVAGQPEWTWKPHIIGTNGDSFLRFEKDGEHVALYLGLYLQQSQGRELVQYSNRMVAEDNQRWKNKSIGANTGVRLDNKSHTVGKALIASGPTNRILALHWYRIGGHYTVNPYMAKALESINNLFGLRTDAAYIVVAGRVDTNAAMTINRLQLFIDDMLPSIELALDNAALSSGQVR